MVKTADEVFAQEIIREDAVDVLIGSGYGDIIDLMIQSKKTSIFDSPDEEDEEEEVELDD